MLKQILRDMFVDPEILAGLDDTQKQTLFCKMREEQIRRWRLWDQKHERLEAASDHPGQQPAVVRFLHGADDEPWVWVMGEHENDRSIDSILADEAKVRARKLAEIETQELRKSYAAEMHLVDLSSAEAQQQLPKMPAIDEAVKSQPQSTKNSKLPEDPSLLEATPTIGDGSDPDANEDLNEEIYCTVDQLRNPANAICFRKAPAPQPPTSQPPASVRPLVPLSTTKPTVKPDVLREITRHNRQQQPPQKVSAKIALWEKRVIGEKTNEIFRMLQQRQQVDAAEAESAARKRESEWQEQEVRAKQAEQQRRDIARRARDEHRRSIVGGVGGGAGPEAAMRDSSPLSSSSASSLSSNSLDQGGNGTSSAASAPSSLDSTVSRPPNAEAVSRWYREEEFGRGAGLEAGGRPHRWFAGVLSRAEAERRLAGEQAGAFLVRLSEKIWGYAISYRDAERCKHYLVDASAGGVYQFLGANQLSHDSLNELIRFHANVPITLIGQELLLRPCSPSSIAATVPPIFDGLIIE